jgi:hypothetical protein
VLAWAASTLAHAEPDAALEIIGRDREALGLLRRAQQLAATVGRRELVADAERKIGYVALLEARYGADAESAARVHREAHGLVADRIFAVEEGA